MNLTLHQFCTRLGTECGTCEYGMLMLTLEENENQIIVCFQVCGASHSCLFAWSSGHPHDCLSVCLSVTVLGCEHAWCAASTAKNAKKVRRNRCTNQAPPRTMTSVKSFTLNNPVAMATLAAARLVWVGDELPPPTKYSAKLLKRTSDFLFTMLRIKL